MLKFYYSSVASLKLFGKRPTAPPKQKPDFSLPKPHPVLMNDPLAYPVSYRIPDKPLSPMYEVPIEARLSLFPYFESPVNSKFISVAVLGAPNAGKSSLINTILGQEILPVSRKRNTTSKVIQGIKTIEDTQIVLYDTPGILSTHYSRTNAVSLTGWETVKESNYSLFVVDAMRPIANDIRAACSKLQKLLCPKQSKLEEAKLVGETEDEYLSRKELVKNPIRAGLVVSKVDLVKDRRRVRFLVNELNEYAFFDRVFYVSAQKNYNVKELTEFLMGIAEPEEWIFHPSQVTTLSDIEQAQGIVKQQLFEVFHDELPYEWVPRVIGWTPFLSGTLRVDMEVLVKNSIQRGIFIGRESRNIKKIAGNAEYDLLKLYKRPVKLVLHVRIMKEVLRKTLQRDPQSAITHPRLITHSTIPTQTIKQLSNIN